MKKITCFIVALMGFSLYSQTMSSTANYNVTFQSTWNATEHSSVPPNAHWSNLVGATHNTENEFLELGQNATTGIKDVAEIGDHNAFFNEVQSAISAGNAEFWYNEDFNPNNATSSTTINLDITEDHPYLTLVSMVAPSPDWFIAINSLDLRDPLSPMDGWKDDFIIDVYAYDAGTDNGTNYDSPNSPNAPVAISMINGFPINGNRIGTLNVDLQGVTLSTSEFDTSDDFKISPNPSKGHVKILGDNLRDLKSIKVYNILGSLVKDIKTTAIANQLNINLSDLSKGLYLVKLNTKNSETTTQKLIIE